MPDQEPDNREPDSQEQDAEAGSEYPSEAQGVHEDQFNVWRQHPVTQMFRKYLLDATDDLWGAIKDQWIDGNLTLSEEEDVRGYIRAHRDIEGLRFAQISKFYAEIAEMNERENEPDGAEDTQD